MFKLIDISKLVKLGWFVQTQTKCVLARQVMQSVFCADQVTKNVLDGSAGPHKQMGQMKYKTKRNIFRHIQTKECVHVCESSELAE